LPALKPLYGVGLLPRSIASPRCGTLCELAPFPSVPGASHRAFRASFGVGIDALRETGGGAVGGLADDSELSRRPAAPT
jgi:hypothetical protein